MIEYPRFHFKVGDQVQVCVDEETHKTGAVVRRIGEEGRYLVLGYEVAFPGGWSEVFSQDALRRAG